MHDQICQNIFQRACKILGLQNFSLQTIGQAASLQKSKNRYILGSTKLKQKLVRVKIYTPKTGKQKKYSSILSVIAHELAHHQKPPYRQFFQGRWINRIHYPEFYNQVKKNIFIFKSDPILSKLYKNGKFIY